MVSFQKIITFCFCLMLALFGVLVEGGGGMMGGLFGGGGGKHSGGYGGIETLLAAGLLARLLRGQGAGGGFGLGRAAAGPEVQAAPMQFGFQPGFGF